MGLLVVREKQWREEHLGCDDLLVAVVLREDVTEDAFAVALRVDVGGVEEIDTEVDCPFDNLSALVLVEWPVTVLRGTEAHAPETDFRDLQAGRAKCRVLHSGGLLNV